MCLVMLAYQTDRLTPKYPPRNHFTHSFIIFNDYLMDKTIARQHPRYPTHTPVESQLTPNRKSPSDYSGGLSLHIHILHLLLAPVTPR